MPIPSDLRARESVRVAPADCASVWGNDNLQVLSTPAMLGHVERLCVKRAATLPG